LPEFTNIGKKITMDEKNTFFNDMSSGVKLDDGYYFRGIFEPL
jgi:hypothetical protein